MAMENEDTTEIAEQPDGSALVTLPEAEDEEVGFGANLAEKLSDFKLQQLASDLLDLIEKDKDARKKRDEQQEEGLRRTGLGDDAPGGATFSGASKTVHPVLAEGCVDFSARAMKEIFPARGPVKTKIYGKEDRPKLDKAKRKKDFLNWQLTNKISEYRAEKEVMLTQLPLGGSQYEKYWIDPVAQRIKMEFVPIDEILLPFSASSFYGASRVTHVQNIIKSTFEDRIRSGFYRDIRNSITEGEPEPTASEEANRKIEGKEPSGYNEDGTRTIYETHCLLNLEDEEDEELKPYIVHIDASADKILAIYQNWREGDESYTKLDWLVENKFIPWRGAYGIGLLHLIGSLAGSATGALRALLDSAHINNTPTAIKLKGGRASGANTTVEVTAVQEIDAPPGVDDIRKVIMGMPFNQPSPVLFQLLEWLTNQAKGVVATAEERIADASNNMPVGTALALIEQGSQVFSAIHARLHASQAKALEIICRLNFDYPNVEDMARFGLTPEDFKDNDDVEPVSDPNIFSEAQRYAQLQEELKLVGMFPDLPWNRFELVKRGLELLRVDHSDEVLPKPPEPFTGDPVSENTRALMGSPLKASPDQDHLAHLQEHLRALNDPLLGGNPLFPGPLLQNILANCAQHLVFLYSASAMTAATVRMAKTGGQDREKTIADAAGEVMGGLQEVLPQLAQQIAQAQQLVMSKMPQPPQDPAVQATLQAAMAETERRKAVDAQTFQLKQMEFQRDTQFQSMEGQMAQQQQQFENMLAAQEQASKDRSAQLEAQLKLIMNKQDNESHQITELLKNKDDNDTAVIIEQMKQQLASMQEMVSTATAGRDRQEQVLDLSPIMQQLQSVLETSQKAQKEDDHRQAMQTIMQGIQGIGEHLARPKIRRIIEDDKGKPIGMAEE